jgi:hypothetical protein
MTKNAFRTASQIAFQLFNSSPWAKPEGQAELLKVIEARIPLVPGKVRKTIAASLLGAVAAWLSHERRQDGEA